MVKHQIDFDRKQQITRILQAALNAGEGHIPSALSILDILNVIYKEKIQNNQFLEHPNEFILSKGHGSLALYALLEEYGFIPTGSLETYCDFDSILGGHPDSTLIPGVFASTGSLGHGLPIAVGLALAKKIKNATGQVLVLVGDGEINEGTTWESGIFASHHALNNLVCIVDNNQSTTRALNLGNLQSKFESLGWECRVVDGHDWNQISLALHIEQIAPLAIIANTVKGKGIKEMENNPAWHHAKLNSEDFNRFVIELK